LKLSGLTFEDAWELAWRQVVWPHDTDHRRQWKAALRDTRPEWYSCYLGEPSVARGNIVELAVALMPQEEQRGDVSGMVTA
jgi:hypothetical protein